MVSIGRLIFKATGVMSNRGLVKNSSKIGTAIAEKMWQSGGKIESADVHKIISDTIGKKASSKIKFLNSRESAQDFMLKQGLKQKDINQAFDACAALTAPEKYRRHARIYINEPYLNSLAEENPVLPAIVGTNALAHEIQHAISFTSGYLSVPKLIGKFKFGRKMIDKANEKSLKYNLQAKYMDLYTMAVKKYNAGMSLNVKDIKELLYSKGILTPGKDKENTYILRYLKKVYADEVRSYSVGFDASAKYAGTEVPAEAKNVIALFDTLSKGAGEELNHVRLNQVKQTLGIKPDMSREQNIIRQSQESERLAAELLSRFSETIKNSKSKPLSFN